MTTQIKFMLAGACALVAAAAIFVWSQNVPSVEAATIAAISPYDMMMMNLSGKLPVENWEPAI